MGFGLEGATTKHFKVLGWCRGTGHWCKGIWDLVKGRRVIGPLGSSIPRTAGLHLYESS